MGQAQSMVANAVNSSIGAARSAVGIALKVLIPANSGELLVVGAFDYKEIPNNDGTTNIEFTNLPKVSEIRKVEAVFMKNVVEDVTGTLRALKVDPTDELNEMKKRGKFPLFCIHGFLGSPDLWIDQCKKVPNPDPSKYELVPVLWPANNIRATDLVPFPIKVYDEARKDATKAAKVLKEAFKSITGQKKSVVAVSMGNWLLQELARLDNPQVLNFDEIFMVAADVDEDIFNKNKNEGKNIIDMLSNENENGKVYVVHNTGDEILKASESSVLNNKTRLGQNGAIGETSPKVENVDVSEKQKDRNDDFGGHGYMFEEYMMKFYNQENGPDKTIP